MLTIIEIVVAVVMAQFISMAIVFAMFKNKTIVKWFYKWVMDYMKICGELVEEMEEAE